jgi:aminoglycoside phosphotransferase (APT) family kinase protein
MESEIKEDSLVIKKWWELILKNFMRIEMDFHNIVSLVQENSDISYIYDVKPIKEGLCFNTYEIVLRDGQTLILRLVRNKREAQNVKKLKWEFEIQNQLYGNFPVPKQVLFCNDYTKVDSPFYLYEKVEGIVKRDIRSIKKSFELLLQLHTIPLENFSMTNMRVEKNLKNIINKNYGIYINSVDHVDMRLHKIYEWLIENIPDMDNISLIHNDWRSDNMIFLGDEISAVLDWELSCISFSELDIGVAMAYLNEMEEEEVLNNFNIDNSSNYKFCEIFGIMKMNAIINAVKKNKVSDIIKNENVDWILESKIEKALRRIS